MDKTALGDRMKSYESRHSYKLLPNIPIVARIDGRSFSKFTKGLARPYDKRMSDLMVEVTRYLVAETNAKCGYTQSDEISLVWKTNDPLSSIFFDGKFQKMVSITSAMATARFNQLLDQYLPEKVGQLPLFDSRVFELPNDQEAVNNFIWREKDAKRNSIQMAAHCLYSPNQLHKKNSSELQDMLHLKGINWNDYPRFFKRGTYVRKRVITREYTNEELSSLPLKHLARTNPGLEIKRSVVMAENIPPLTKIDNKVGFLLYGEDPILIKSPDQNRPT